MLPERPDRAPDLELTVVGSPKTKGSVKAFIPKRKDGSMVTRENGSPMVVKTDDTGAEGKQWMAAVAERLDEAMNARGLPMIRDAGVWVEAVFYRPRPKGHFGTGRNAGVLKDSAPPFPASRPDVDKLERAVLDAAKGVLWTDDGQVVALPTLKAFGEPARLELRVWVLPATIGELAAALQPTLTVSSGAV